MRVAVSELTSSGSVGSSAAAAIATSASAFAVLLSSYDMQHPILRRTSAPRVCHSHREGSAVKLVRVGLR